MSIPGLFSTQTVQVPGRFHIFVNGTDVAPPGPAGAGAVAASVSITSAIDAGAGAFSANVGDPLLAYSLPARARVLVTDDAAGVNLFDGWLTSRGAVPDFGQQGRTAALAAGSAASMLDAAMVVPAIAYPAGLSDQAVIQGIVGTYCPGEIYTTPYVQATNVAMPAMTFGSQSIRSAIEQVGLAANGDAQGERHYYLDAYRNLHYFLTEANPAPKNINTTPSGTEVAPSDLQITYDDSAIRTAVFVRGSTAAGTGWVIWGAGVAAYGWLADQLDVTDSDTFAKQQAYGWAYLVPRSQPVIRGTFSTDAVGGWVAGQTVLVTVASMGLAATPLLIYQVTRSQASGAYASYAVSFGAKPPSLSMAR